MNSRKLGAIIVYSSLILLVIGLNTGYGRARVDIGEFGSSLHRPAVLNYPCKELAVHSINRLGLSITNMGHFGNGFADGQVALIDQVTGVPGASAVYPYPGANEYLFAGAFWIGAVVGRDTLVSVGADGWQTTREMWPPPCDAPYNGAIDRLSISNEADILLGAKSEQDFIAVYTDTVTDPGLVSNDLFDSRPHIPLQIEITQRSFAWSYDYAADFVLFDYEIKSINRKDLQGVYMGIYVDGDVGPTGASIEEATDDVCGFKDSILYPFAPVDCDIWDPIRIAWIADNDGRKNDASLQCPSGFDLTSVAGVRVVRTPSDSLKYSFNWWISNGDQSKDFGPRKASTPEDPFRDFGGFLGTPEGDRNKYYIMRHEEFDYDQLFTARDNSADGWLAPLASANDFANGYDTRFLMSFGPFNIAPGEVLRVSFAYVAGEDFHQRCEAFEDLWNPSFPEAYYDQLNFDKFGTNAVWAAQIYDNPGRDTNGDSTFGTFEVCCYDSAYVYDTTQVEPEIVIDTNLICLDADTFWMTGDGVPDFEGARPPYPPKMWVYPSIDEFDRGQLRVRFNGFESETRKDDFSNDYDFEGYRIYQALTSRAGAFVLLTSYDREDYNRFEFDDSRNEWVLVETPFTREELQEMYGPEFDPNQYNVDNLYYDTDADELYYFTPQDWNQSDLNNPDLIHKLYPDEPLPTLLNLDSAKLYYPEELTDDGYFKYYEYEYTINNLLPSQLYYISVTAFDYGSPVSGLPSLETAKNQNMISEYAQNINSIVEEEGLNVVVYPNPYRNDAGYSSPAGGEFEGRDIASGQTAYEDRIRRINFTNLPHKCTIRIFTIDGDLVREIEHDFPKDDPQSMHDSWDLITRNTQAAVSGLYYYSVESEYGNQIGKLVIIM